MTAGAIAGGVRGGALIGGAIGTAAEPVGGTAVGAIVGGIVGGAIVVGGLIWLAATAKDKSDENLDEDDKTKVCETCPTKICFNTPEGGDPGEMRRQLQEQTDAINKMSPEKLLENMKRYDEIGRAAGDAAARRVMRSRMREQMIADIQKELLKEVSAGDALEEATRLADERMRMLDATHDIDLKAGGSGKLSGLGDSKTNRSIGGQWNQSSTEGGPSRVDQLKAAAEKAAEAGKPINVKLDVC